MSKSPKKENKNLDLKLKHEKINNIKIFEIIKLNPDNLLNKNIVTKELSNDNANINIGKHILNKSENNLNLYLESDQIQAAELSNPSNFTLYESEYQLFGSNSNKSNSKIKNLSHLINTPPMPPTPPPSLYLSKSSIYENILIRIFVLGPKCLDKNKFVNEFINNFVKSDNRKVEANKFKIFNLIKIENINLEFKQSRTIEIYEFNDNIYCEKNWESKIINLLNQSYIETFKRKAQFDAIPDSDLYDRTFFDKSVYYNKRFT